MKNATLVFLINKEENKILLGMKKRGFGEGKLNGFGGKVKESESVEEASVRELLEETGVKTSVEKLRKMGELTFKFPFVKDKTWDQVVHVFFTDFWEGEPTETEEMRPEWVDISNIPFDKMWQDDKHWLPLVLKDRKVKAEFSFKEDNESIHQMQIEDLE